MSDTASIWLLDETKTRSSGASLARTLYELPVTVLLRGELGAGKTTFLQGIAQGLHCKDRLTSPTYALEKCYECFVPRAECRFRAQLLHIDLYRLNRKQAQELVSSTDDHTGIRCIEWADRIDQRALMPSIDIHLADMEDKPGRSLNVSFRDIPLPTGREIDAWRQGFHVPEPIRRHCDAVASLTEKLASILLKRGEIVRPLALRRGAQVHDLLRFVDFRPGAGHTTIAETPRHSTKIWERVKEKYQGMRHEAACAAFLRERGYGALASIVEVHGLHLPSPERVTTEQKLLFYADKRVKLDEVVTLRERFEDFQRRYGGSEKSRESRIWFEEAQRVEEELFPISHLPRHKFPHENLSDDIPIDMEEQRREHEQED